MARFAYKEASRWIGFWFLCSFLGVVGLHAAIFFMIGSRLDRVLGGWVLLLGFAPLGIAVGTAWILTSRWNRQRVRGVLARLEARGFDTVEKPTEAARTDFAAPLAHLFAALDLRHGPVGIQWTAVQREGAARMRIFEHRFMTGSGKSTQEHFHSVLVWPAGHPDLRDPGVATAPWFFMAQYPRFIRRGVRERELKGAAFADVDPRWSLLHDPGTGARVLTPAVRRALAGAPKAEAWFFGAGWVGCTFKATVDGENMDRFLVHAREVLAGVGP